MQSKQLCAAKRSSNQAAKQHVSQPRYDGCWRDRRQADQVNFFQFIWLKFKFLAVRAHAHVPKFGLSQLWMMDALAG
jgi:hypothetical protein